MEKIIIISHTAKSEGVILETNIPARLKPNRMASKETFVSWDSIGKLLFENYTYEIEVSELDKLRNKHMKPLPIAPTEPEKTFKDKVIGFIEERMEELYEKTLKAKEANDFTMASLYCAYRSESSEILEKIKEL